MDGGATNLCRWSSVQHLGLAPIDLSGPLNTKVPVLTVTSCDCGAGWQLAVFTL